MGEQQRFKSLFKLFRERASLTKSEVARRIRKTDGYVRKLENYGYTPPTFEICQQLITVFGLNQNESLLFLRHAFLERIQSESLFYEKVHGIQAGQSSSKKSSVLLELPQQIAQLEGSQQSKCTYLLRWYTAGREAWITPKIKEILFNVIVDTISDFGNYFQSLSINETGVQLLVDVAPSSNLQDFIRGLKLFTAGALKNKVKSLSHLNELWSEDDEIFTVGMPSELKEFEVSYSAEDYAKLVAKSANKK